MSETRYVKVGHGLFSRTFDKLKKAHDKIKNANEKLKSSGIISKAATLLGKDGLAADAAQKGYGYRLSDKHIMVGEGLWNDIKRAASKVGHAVGSVAKGVYRGAKGAVNLAHQGLNAVGSATGMNPSTIALMTGNPVAAAALKASGHGKRRRKVMKGSGANQVGEVKTSGRFLVLKNGPAPAGLASRLV